MHSFRSAPDLRGQVRRHARHCVAVVTPLLLAAAQAAAQAEGPTVLAPVDVRADRVQSSVERAIAERRAAPNARVVIEREELTQYNDLPIGDLLRRLPSVTFDGGNRAREPRLRGVAREYTQVLINGRRLLDGAASRTVQLDRLPSSIVERVEIIRSPLAETSGEGAAGTINIVLRNDIQTPITELGIGVGLYETRGLIADTNVLHAGRTGPLSYRLLGSVQAPARNESSDSAVFGPNETPNRGELGLNQRRYGQVALLPAFTLHLGERSQIFLEPSYLFTRENRFDRRERMTVAQTAIDRIEEEKRTRFRETYGVLLGATHGIGALTGTLALDVQTGREDTVRRAERFQPPGTLNQQRRRTENIGFNRINPTLRVAADIDRHALSAGLGYSFEDRKEGNTDLVNGIPQAPNDTRQYRISEQVYSAFVQDTITLGDGRLTLGTRYEASRTRTRDAADAREVVTAGRLLPSASYVHTLWRATDLRIGVARTLRRPDLRELSPTVSTQGGTVGNPDTGGNPLLKPERIWGADLGIDHAIHGGRGLLSANLFGRQVEGRIEPVISFESGRAVRRPQNMGDGSFWGAELEARLPLDALALPELSVWGNVAFIDSRVDDPELGRKRRFADQPRVLGTVGIDWFVEPLATTFGVAANWRGRTGSVQGQPGGGELRTDRDSALRIDLSARAELAPAISLTVSVLNLIGGKEKVTSVQTNAAGTATATTREDEPTYRTFYVATRFRF